MHAHPIQNAHVSKTWPAAGYSAMHIQYKKRSRLEEVATGYSARSSSKVESFKAVAKCNVRLELLKLPFAPVVLALVAILDGVGHVPR